MKMKSLSLIHAIVLLHEKECLSKRKGVGQLVRDIKNIAQAKELACRVLGRNLGKIPRKTQILFLLIEKMRERVCEEKRIGHSVYRFTREDVQAYTGWRDEVIASHLKILEGSGYVRIRAMKYRILLKNSPKKRLNIAPQRAPL